MAQSESPRDDDYKALPDANAETRGSRHSLKSKERCEDGAGEQLLSKAKEAQIVTQENMADAKYVVGDHRNGDAKIDIDSNKRTFTGLSKEELLKYQDDPFWVRLRWTMFVLFWALWVCMLVGAIAIIVKSPKCLAPQPKKWYEQGPLVDLGEASSLPELEEKLPLLQEARVQGVILPAELFGDIYDLNNTLTGLQSLAGKAKDAGIKVIVDMTANFVKKSHEWFSLSERSEAEYADYFVWATGKGQEKPNNWVSTLDESAWTWSEQRKAYYLHQYSADTPDLNFNNPRVADIFDEVIRKWAAAGASGIRLQKVRQLLVNKNLANDSMKVGRAGVPHTHDQYGFYTHYQTSDRPELIPLLQRWRNLAYQLNNDFLLTMAEPVSEVYRTLDAGNQTTYVLDLPSAGSASMKHSTQELARHLETLLPYWPAVQLTSDADTALEAGVLSQLLPATPILAWDQIFILVNNTWKVEPAYKHIVALRSEPVLMHGHYNITTFAEGSLLGITRWMSGGAGYAAVYNPTEHSVSGDATQLPRVPDAVAAALLSHNYNTPNVTLHSNIHSKNLVVSPRSIIVLAFVPVADK